MAKNIIMIYELYDCECRDKYETFDEAYAEMKKRYIDSESHGWYEEEWEENFSYDETKTEFEKNGYVKFCDNDAITTPQYFMEHLL